MAPQRASAAPADIFKAGNSCAAAGDYAAALACYEQVRALRPGDPGVHNNMAATLQRLGRLPEAVAAYRRAIAIDPALHKAINSLGNALLDLGQFAEARAAYRAAIRLAPRRGVYYRNLARSGGLSVEEPLLADMQRMSSGPEADALPAEDRIFLHFALAEALGQAGQHAAAFDHLLAGNALQRAHVAYHEAATLALLARVQDVFSAALINAMRGAGDPSAMPVFIVGMPRSGSTLIEQILASHPGVFGAGERADFPQALKQIAPPDGGAAAGIGAATTLSPAQCAALGVDYGKRLRQAADHGSYRRITDKYLTNYLCLGLIHMALPNARIIHCRRAAIDTCLSCFARLFEDVPFSYDLGELGRYYRAYDALMAHWNRVLPPGVMITVQYEDLVADLEGQTRRMLTHCGLEWHDACLAFHATARVVRTESAVQVRQPLYRTSLLRWRPPADRLQPLLDGLGGLAAA